MVYGLNKIKSMNNYKLFKGNIIVLGFKGIIKVLYSRLFLLFQNKCPKIGFFFLRKKHEIMREFIGIIDKNSLSNVYTHLPKNNDLINNTIWMFWWQGENQMPLIVRRCIQSVKQHALGYNIVIITSDNINNYVTLPDSIMKKVGNNLTYTQFSDIVRLSLLNAYGGGWIDATLMLTDDLPNYVKESDFFTIKNQEKEFYCVSSYRWTNGFMFAKKGCPIIQDLCRLFFHYWENYNDRIDYFLLDYCWDYLYRKDISYKKLIDNVEISNPKMFEHGFLEYADKPYDVNVFNSIVKDTWCHKLSYKRSYSEDNTMLNYLINIYA